MTNKQIIDRVYVKECKYYCNGKCERYEEFVEADYANYSVKCICEKENDLGTYDICDYQQLQRKEQENKDLREDIKDIADLLDLDTGEEYNFGNIELEIKQLQAKEQECEELKKANDEKNELLAKLGCPTIATARMKAFTLEQQLEAYKMEAEEGKEINAELKAENEELKKIIERLDVPKHEVIDMDIALENEKLKAENEILKEKITISSNSDKITLKIIKTLTEIKEIVNKNYKTEEELFKIRHSRLPKFSMGALNGRHNLASEILQKISECEVNNDMEN